MLAKRATAPPLANAPDRSAPLERRPVPGRADKWQCPRCTQLWPWSRSTCLECCHERELPADARRILESE